MLHGLLPNLLGTGTCTIYPIEDAPGFSISDPKLRQEAWEAGVLMSPTKSASWQCILPHEKQQTPAILYTMAPAHVVRFCSNYCNPTNHTSICNRERLGSCWEQTVRNVNKGLLLLWRSRFSQILQTLGTSAHFLPSSHPFLASSSVYHGPGLSYPCIERPFSRWNPQEM